MSGRNRHRKRKIIRALVAMAISATLWSVTVYAIVASDDEMFQEHIHPPMVSLSRSAVPDGVRFVAYHVQFDLSWSRVTVELMNLDTSNCAIWDNASESLLSEGAVGIQNLGVATLGDASLRCVITDLGGNGVLDSWDFFTIEGELSPGTQYRFSLICEPPGGGTMATNAFIK